MNDEQPRPTQGWLVSTSYNTHKRAGEFKIIDIDTGQFIAKGRFKNVLTSDNIIGLIAICRACQYKIEYGYTEKIYCANQVACHWAIKKTFNTSISSPDIITLVTELLETLNEYDFTKAIIPWNHKWGRMKDYLCFLDRKRNKSDLEI